MAKSNASGLLTSLDSLFTTQEQRDAAKRDVVLDLPLDQIGDFPNHPFKVRQDEAMMEMMESVQLHGVLVPGLVRQLADGSYQMVSGHRRKLASRLAGLDTLPCIVRDLTDDEAIIVMVDSNLQREKVLPSEKAFACRTPRRHEPLSLPCLQGECERSTDRPAERKAVQRHRHPRRCDPCDKAPGRRDRAGLRLAVSARPGSGARKIGGKRYVC